MNLGPNPTVANPAPTTAEKLQMRTALGAFPVTLTGNSAPVDNDATVYATAIGQRYRAGASPPYTWYRAITAGASASTWEIDGEELTDVAIATALGYTPADEAAIIAPTALTFASVDPNIKFLTLASIGTDLGLPDPDPVVTTNTTTNGCNAFTNTLGGVVLVVSYTGTAWQIKTDGVVKAEITSAAASPVGLTGWTLTPPLATDPAVTGSPLAATHLGQWCKASTAWWQWDGVAWIEMFTLAGDPVNVTATTILDKLMGATADPARIGAEFMPESQTISSITFTSGADQALDDGVFTGGTDEFLYRHNGTDNGGVPYTPDNWRRVLESINFPAYTINGEVINAALAGNVSTAVSLATVFTSAATGTLNISVPVAVGDRPYMYGQKIADLWNANATFAASYYASMAGSLLQVQSKTGGVNDATRSFSIPAGTSGITTKSGGTASQFFYAVIARFPILASEATVGQIFTLDGTLRIYSTAAIGTAKFGVLPDGGTGVSFSATSLSYTNIVRDAAGVIVADISHVATPIVLKTVAAGYLVSMLSTDVATANRSRPMLELVDSATNLVTGKTVTTYTAPTATGMFGLVSERSYLTLVIQLPIDLTSVSTVPLNAAVDLTLRPL